MTTTTALPTSSDVQLAELEAFRAVALALRDMAETARASEATLTIVGGQLVCDVDGLHFLPADGGAPVDLTEWVDYAGMVPA